jgi:hypothetical protein
LQVGCRRLLFKSSRAAWRFKLGDRYGGFLQACCGRTEITKQSRRTLKRRYRLSMSPLSASIPRRFHFVAPIQFLVAPIQFPRLLSSSSIVMIGLRAGGSRPTDIGGVIQPLRTASSNNASDSTGLRAGPGGPIFRDHAVAIRHQNGLSAGSEPDVLTQFVL